MNPNIINNPVYEKPVEVNVNLLGDTGKILYCNGLGGLTKVDELLPEMKSLLESTQNISGSTILMQLKTLFNNNIADGPWYVDLVNNTLFIHNRNWSDPVIENYTYYQEHGEVLKITFNLQSKFQGKNRVLSKSHYNPINQVIEKIEVSEPELGPEIPKADPDNVNKKGNLSINHVELNDATRVGNIPERNNPMAAHLDSRARIQKAVTEQYRNEYEREQGVENYRKTYNTVSKATSPGTRKQTVANAYVSDAGVTEEQAVVQSVQLALKQQQNNLTHKITTQDVKDWWKIAKRRAINEGSNNVPQAAYEFFRQSISKYGLNLDKVNMKVHLEGEAVKKGPLNREIVHIPKNIVRSGKTSQYIRSLGYMYDSTMPGAVDLGRVSWEGNSYWFGKNNGGYAINGNGYFVQAWRQTYKKEGYTIQSSDFIKAACMADPDTQMFNQMMALQEQQNRTQAELNALKNALKKTKEKELTADMDVVGRPSLVAARYINVYNIGNIKLDGKHPLSGKWYIKRCVHTFTPQGGYITSLSMVKR